MELPIARDYRPGMTFFYPSVSGIHDELMMILAVECFDDERVTTITMLISCTKTPNVRILTWTGNPSDQKIFMYPWERLT